MIRRAARERLLLLLVLGLGLPLAAQVAAPQVRPEFRRAARPLITQNIDRNQMVTTAGAMHAEVATAQDLGARDPFARMDHIQLVLQRPQERQAAFDALVDALHQPGNPSYHQWLTPELIGAEFGPSATDLSALTNYLQAEGFTTIHVAKSGMSVDFSGTVAQVQQSFHTEIHNLRLASGEDRYSAVRDAQLPAALTPLVAGFASLGNITPHPMMVPLEPAVSSSGLGPVVNASPNDSSGGNYYVGAQDFYTIYNENSLLAGGTNGAGITVALLEQSDINTADVTSFRTLLNVSPATPAITVLHGSASVTCTDPGTLKNSGDEGEAVLDTEWAGAVAPMAALLYMSCQDVLLSAQAVVEDNLAPVMSLSYGNTEVGFSTQNTIFANLWEQAAAQGQTVVVSAGDAGSGNSADQGKTIATHGLAVNGLASSGYNVAAGGTDFQDAFNQIASGGSSTFNLAHYWKSANPTGSGLSSALGYVAETTWNNTCASPLLIYRWDTSTTPNALCDDATNGPNFHRVAGAGGGVSIQQPRPSWQTGTVFGIPPTSTYNFRLLPDVSLFAANGIWLHALDYYESDVQHSLLQAGGTSFVAPQLAGMFALIAQKTVERLGQPNYVLYNMAGTEFGIASYTAGNTCNGSGGSGLGSTMVTTSAPASTCIFYDIETGNNAQACTAGTVNCYSDSGTVGIFSLSTSAAQPAYPTTQGFDLATGIGSVNIANLVNNWQNATAGGITYTPTVAVSATASSYIYGHPSAITYTATVSGPGSFPTGSVTFFGSPTISTIGTDSLIASGGCASAGVCTESATQAYTPPGSLAGGSYSIFGTYSSTNENYVSGSASTTLTVTRQTPTVTVTAVTIGAGTPTANFTAKVAYTGIGLAPSGGLTFQVDSGVTVTASCTGSSSPITCTYSGYNTSALTVGGHTITATSLVDTNYTLATGSNTLTVLALPTIVFTVPNHHTLDQPFTVSASSNSAGAITYSVLSGPAGLSGNTVTLTGAAGTVVLQASQAANGSFAAGSQTTSFLVIAGSVWLGNSTGSLSAFDLTGAALTGSSGFTGAGVGTIASPLGLAFDASGNAWVASSNGVSKFSRQGVAISSTAYTSGGVSNPEAIAIDGLGQVWVANAGGTVSVLSNAGTAVSPSTGYAGSGTAPAGIAIDISGSVWIANKTANTVTRILGVAAPVAPLATGAAFGPGVRP